MPRREQARGTRRRIVAAARGLFLERGYAATTLEAVAERAGVAVQTVYFHFRNKRTVLGHVVDEAASGDDLPVALLERPWLDRVRESPDAVAAVAVWCEVSREIYGRVVPIMRVVREAAGSDADMAAQQATNRRQTLAAHRLLAEHLADRDALRDGLDVTTAGEVLYALLGIDGYVLVTDELGWEPARWQEWVEDLVLRTVLRDVRSRSAADGP